MFNSLNRQKIQSPTSSIRSLSISSYKHHPKIRLPKNSKLSNFFTFSNSNSKDKLNIQGKSKPIITQSLRLSKATSLKSLACSSLARKMKQSVKLNNQEKFEIQLANSFQKDQSRTRSRLTIMQEYGINPIQTKIKKPTILLPKTPKSIRSTNGKKKIVFPVHNFKNQKKTKLNNIKSVQSLQYTFGLQGIGLLKNSIH